MTKLPRRHDSSKLQCPSWSLDALKWLSMEASCVRNFNNSVPKGRSADAYPQMSPGKNEIAG